MFVRKDRPSDGVVGKYLFFSESVAKLSLVAWKCLVDGRFPRAHLSPSNGAADRLLCVFWTGPEMDCDLHNRFRGTSGVLYRGWKQDGEPARRKKPAPVGYVKRRRGSGYGW